MNQFGENINMLRIKHCLLQGEIAYELGMDTTMLSKMECDQRNAISEQFEIQCKKFKVLSMICFHFGWLIRYKKL